MQAPTESTAQRQTARELVQRIMRGELAVAGDLAVCRALLGADRESEAAYQALCMLLEACLADPSLSIDDTRTVVRLLQALARGELVPGDLL